MLDERLKTRDERKMRHSLINIIRHSREGGNLPHTTSRKLSSWRSVGPIGSIMHLSSLSLSKGLLLISLLFLAACTDYVQQMDDGFDEWEQAQKQKTLSSSNQTEKSCSSEELSSSSFSVILSSDSHEKSSSSTEKKNSSSSNNKASSSSAKSSSSNKVSSSSEQKNKSSSSVKTTSSSSKNTSSSSFTKSSSSSAKAVSSSSKKNEVSSSSENVKLSSSGKASWAYLNPAISYGEIVDDRDGQVYKTVKIGEQTWMAENLNYETANSYCYNDSTKYCDKYGRLYTWAAAKTVCPIGWELPSKTEFEILRGNKANTGQMLKSTEGWKENSNGFDTYGFSAFPAGERDIDGHYNRDGYYAHFWSSTENDGNTAYDMYLYYKGENAILCGTSYKDDGYSVRCIMKENNPPKSSSSVASSSSVKYGILTDDRDGKTYKTIVIGSQTWMAENLNFETENSSCYNDSAKYCDKYGRLYTWAAAMDSAGMWSSGGKGCGMGNTCTPTYPVQGICPKGWHLPTKEELVDLISFVGGESTAGKKLKSTSGWEYDLDSGNGLDTYSFSALPAGCWYNNGFCNGAKYLTYFCSSTEYNKISAYSMYIRYNGNYAVLKSGDDDYYKNYGYSIRCIKD